VAWGVGVGGRREGPLDDDGGHRRLPGSRGRGAGDHEDPGGDGWREGAEYGQEYRRENGHPGTVAVSAPPGKSSAPGWG